MFCKQCGNQLMEGGTFCGRCGLATSAVTPPTPTEQPVIMEAPIVNEPIMTSAFPSEEPPVVQAPDLMSIEPETPMVTPDPVIMPEVATPITQEPLIVPTPMASEPVITTDLAPVEIPSAPDLMSLAPEVPMTTPEPVAMPEVVAPVIQAAESAPLTEIASSTSEPMATAPINQQPVFNNPAKNNNLLKAGISAAVVVIVAISFFFVGRAMAGGNSNNETGSNSGGATPVATSATSFNGFTLNIPTHLGTEFMPNAEVPGGILVIYDQRAGWESRIFVHDIAFSQVDRMATAQTFRQMGFTVDLSENRNIAGQEFMVIELSVDGEHATITATSASRSRIFEAQVFYESSLTPAALEQIAAILVDATPSNDGTMGARPERPNFNFVLYEE